MFLIVWFFRAEIYEQNFFPEMMMNFASPLKVNVWWPRCVIGFSTRKKEKIRDPRDSERQVTVRR